MKIFIQNLTLVQFLDVEDHGIPDPSAFLESNIIEGDTETEDNAPPEPPEQVNIKTEPMDDQDQEDNFVNVQDKISPTEKVQIKQEPEDPIGLPPPVPEQIQPAASTLKPISRMQKIQPAIVDGSVTFSSCSLYG